MPLVKINMMIAVNGIYEDGVVKLDKKIRTKKSRRVIVSFLDEEFSNESKRLMSSDFFSHHYHEFNF